MKLAFRVVRRTLGALGILSALGGCASAPERIEMARTTVAVEDAEIDADPFALLPGGAVGWGRVDLRKLGGVEYANQLYAVLDEQLPVPRESGFVFARDVDLVGSAAYGAVGFDVLSVLVGRFDKDALEAFLASRSELAGQPLVVGRYAGRNVFVRGGASLSVLTDRTAIVGTELGVRRALERIEEGRLKRSTPAWFDELLRNEKASLAIGLDLDAQVIPSVLRTRLDFLEGLRAARLLGNFEAPGLNLAGTLTYDKPKTASDAAASILEKAEQLRRAELLLLVLRMPRPFRRVEASAGGRDTQIALEVEGRAISIALERRAELASGLAGFER